MAATDRILNRSFNCVLCTILSDGSVFERHQVSDDHDDDDDGGDVGAST